MQQHNNKNKELWNLTESYKKSYHPNVDQGLAQLKGRINKTTRLSVQKRVIQMAATILFLVGLGAAYQLFNRSNLQQLHAANAPVHKILPDGSEVLLNKRSQLSFPKQFTSTKRTVQLNGEAFFKIKKDATQPFIVQTAATEVEVLGTSFNLRAYETESTTGLQVEEGKVALYLPKATQPTILTANQKIKYLQEDGILEAITPVNWKDTAWHSPKLTFDNTPLSEIVSYLNSNFDVQIEILSPSLIQCSLTATLVENNALSILNTIEKTFQVVLNTTSSNKYSLSGICQ